MAYYINTKPKVVTNKDVIADVTNAINLKFIKDDIKTKEEIQAKELSAEELSKKSNKKMWNVNSAVPPSEPFNVITYENKNPDTKVIFMSTWSIKCGIATYMSYLLSNINKLCNSEFSGVFPINNKNDMYKVDGDIVHIQHEFGIMPSKIETNSKVIITFHTIYKNQRYYIKQYENDLNVVGYIAHSKTIRDILTESTEKDVYLIPHGSEIVKQHNIEKSILRKTLNFDKLGIKDNDKCAFVFGFQSGNKDFIKIIEACKNTGIKVIISGAKHECGYTNDLRFTKKNAIVLDRYLNDEEVNMFSSACDLLIFDCKSENHYSCSGAMHRVIGSGNPIICSRGNHFNDIIEHDDCLKFEGQKELELKIKKALERKEEFGKKALEYANRTTWENVAKQHLDVYLKCINSKDDNSEDDKIDNKIVDNKEKIIDNKEKIISDGVS